MKTSIRRVARAEQMSRASAPVELTRAARTALWRQIADRIEGEIRAGRLTPGERLPTEHDLAGRFGVNRHTVRRAVAALAESGLVKVEQGRGTFVHKAVLDYVVGKRTRFTESLDRDAPHPRRERIGSRRMAAGADVGRALGIGARGRVERLELISRADDRPLSIAAHYFACNRFDGITRTWDEARSVTRMLARYGIDDYTRRTTRVFARPAEARERELLELARHRPVLVTESVNVDPRGSPIEFGRTSFAADRVQLVFEP